MRKLKNKEKTIKIGAVIGTVGVVGGILSTLRMKRKIRELDEEIGNMDEHYSKFCELQIEADIDFDERINANYGEIISNLEHIECLAKKLD